MSEDHTALALGAAQAAPARLALVLQRGVLGGEEMDPQRIVLKRPDVQHLEHEANLCGSGAAAAVLRGLLYGWQVRQQGAGEARGGESQAPCSGGCGSCR